MNAGIAFISRKSRKTDVAWALCHCRGACRVLHWARICGDCCGAVVYQ